MGWGPDEALLNEVPGGAELIEWFGRVPSFHDAEIVELALERVSARCRLKIHTFHTTPETDAKGHFLTTKHVIVVFQFEGVSELHLEDFNEQNAIDGISLTPAEDGLIHLELLPCYGLAGELKAKRLEISLQPGIPPNSVYAAHAERS